MRDLRAQDPADAVVAWEAVEELLAAVPDSPAKDALRMVAAGVPREEIADRLAMAADQVDVLVARARIRVLTAAVNAPGEERGHTLR